MSEGWGGVSSPTPQGTGVALGREPREPWVCTIYIKLHHREVILKNLSI